MSHKNVVVLRSFFRHDFTNVIGYSVYIHHLQKHWRTVQSVSYLGVFSCFNLSKLLFKAYLEFNSIWPELSFLNTFNSDNKQYHAFFVRMQLLLISMQNNLKPRFLKWPSRVSSKHRKPLLFIFPFTHRKYTQATFYFCKCEIKMIAFHSTKF